MSQYCYFIDESGDSNLKNINQDFPVFVLCGVLMKEEEYQKAEKIFSQFKQYFFDSTGVILHSRDIRKQEGIFQKLFNLTLKQEFYTLLNKALLDIDYQVIAVAVDKKAHIETYGRLSDDPYELALTFLLEQAIDAIGENMDTPLQIMIEARGKKEDEIVARRYSEIYDRGTATIDQIKIKEKLSTKLQFRYKRENDLGLQIADLCAYPTARNFLNPTEPFPAFDVVKKKFYRSGQGVVEGYGLTVFPQKRSK